MTKQEFQEQVKPTIPSGGCLNGHVTVSHAKLVDLLGEPDIDGDKVDAEWAVSFKGKTFAIYNYKTGKNYLGAEGLKTEDITNWHIGGEDKKIAAELISLIDSVE